MFKIKTNDIIQPTLDSSIGFESRPGLSMVEEKAKIEENKAARKKKLLLISPVLISVALGIVGQLILKRGMSDLGPVSLTEHSIIEIMWSIATNLFVIVGMVIFAVSVLFWLVGLSRVELSYAYPFLSLSYVAILAASFLLLGETISPLRLGGVVLVCAGVILVAASDPKQKSE